MELYAYRAHFGPSEAAPRQQQAPLLFDPGTIEAQQFLLCWTSTHQHHPTITPPGVFCADSQTEPPSRPLVAMVAGLPGAPTGHFYGHGPQLPLAPGLLGMDLASPPL